MRLKGIAASPGIATGAVKLVSAKDEVIPQIAVAEEDVEKELSRLNSALEATARDFEMHRAVAQDRLKEELLEVFDAHLLMLKDPIFVTSVEERIKKEHVNAEFALHAAVQDMIGTLLKSEDPYFRERTIDLENLRRRIHLHLSGKLGSVLCDGEMGDIVILADSLSPTETGLMQDSPIAAFATERGGGTSHTAILARALDIPAVVGVNGLLEQGDACTVAIVDGFEGEVILNPGPEDLHEYNRKAEAYKEQRKRMLSDTRPEARTVDGHRVLVSANIDLVEEVESALEAGANGCGLYRSEFLYLDHVPDLPTEADHVATYTEIARAFYPQRVVIRTLDLGGEKYFQRTLEPGTKNPVLGMRAIRYSLAHRDFFRSQLRGILVASSEKNVAVMFPMVTNLGELLATKVLLEECKEELREKGLPFDEDIPVGIMVEVPSCALTARAFVPHVDFFSIGTNDLIQYLLAIDRNNASVAHLYDALNPAVLKCISAVCEAAESGKRDVSVCGEAAATKEMAPLLIGMGVKELSMSPSSIPEQKEFVRRLSHRACRRLARKALKMDTGHDVSVLVGEFLESLDRKSGPVRRKG